MFSLQFHITTSFVIDIMFTCFLISDLVLRIVMLHLYFMFANKKTFIQEVQTGNMSMVDNEILVLIKGYLKCS